MRASQDSDLRQGSARHPAGVTARRGIWPQAGGHLSAGDRNNHHHNGDLRRPLAERLARPVPPSLEILRRRSGRSRPLLGKNGPTLNRTQ